MVELLGGKLEYVCRPVNSFFTLVVFNDSLWYIRLIVEFQCRFSNQNIPSKVVFSQDMIVYMIVFIRYRGQRMFPTILATPSTGATGAPTTCSTRLVKSYPPWAPHAWVDRWLGIYHVSLKVEGKQTHKPTTNLDTWAVETKSLYHSMILVGL